MDNEVIRKKKNKRDVLDAVADAALKFEMDFGGCSQAVVGSHKKILGRPGDEVFRASGVFAAGIGLTGKTCGALSGGCIILGSYVGRDYTDWEDMQGLRFESLRLGKRLVEFFENEYETTICRELQKKLVGRFYDLWTEREKFWAIGGHNADKCPSVCANVAKWSAEILFDEGLIKNGHL